jgi:hypothetical protein
VEDDDVLTRRRELSADTRRGDGSHVDARLGLEEKGIEVLF